jgi:hypothetical protein
MEKPLLYIRRIRRPLTEPEAPAVASVVPPVVVADGEKSMPPPPQIPAPATNEETTDN